MWLDESNKNSWNRIKSQARVYMITVSVQPQQLWLEPRQTPISLALLSPDCCLHRSNQSNPFCSSPALSPLSFWLRYYSCVFIDLRSLSQLTRFPIQLTASDVCSLRLCIPCNPKDIRLWIRANFVIVLNNCIFFTLEWYNLVTKPNFQLWNRWWI